MVRGLRLNMCVFLSSAALAGVAVWAASAHAANSQQSWPASACTLSCGTNGCSTSTLDVVHGDAGGQLQNHDSADVFAVCPVQNSAGTSSIPTVSNGTVYGWSNGSGGTVAACRTFAGGGGGTCGAPKSTGFNAVYAASPSLLVWSAGAANDGYYYRVGMGHKDPAGSVFGIFSYTVGP